MASAKKPQLSIETDMEGEMPLFPNFSVRLPKKTAFNADNQETMPSPKTILSRHHLHRDTSEKSLTNRSGASHRSKYSQGSFLQKSSIFLKSNVLLEESRLESKQEELDTVNETIALCHRKINYLKGAIQKRKTEKCCQSRKVLKNLVRSYPF